MRVKPMRFLNSKALTVFVLCFLLGSCSSIATSSEDKHRDSSVVRQIAEHTYRFAIGGYSTTFFVGEEGVLVFDPLSRGMGANLLDAILQVTDLPVTTVVYSHSHLDHISDAQIFADEAKSRGDNLSIVATEEFVKQAERFLLDIPKPDIHVTVPTGEFYFENTLVNVYTRANFTHTPDTSFFLIPSERVAHFIDVFQADEVPYFDFNGGMGPTALEDTLRAILELEWDFLVTGHGNVADKDDVRFNLQYISDLRDATKAASARIRYRDFAAADLHPYQVFDAFMSALTEDVHAQIGSKYAEYPGFPSVIRGHVIQLRLEYSLYGQ